MKTFIITFALLFFISADMYAGTETAREDSWDFLGIVFFPGVPTSSNDANIAGIRVGLPVAGGKNDVRGIEFAAIGCLTKDLYGIQTAPIFCVSEELHGIQASPVNVADKVVGLQFGIFNASKKASFQLGIINYNRTAWIPVMPLINWNFSDDDDK